MVPPVEIHLPTADDTRAIGAAVAALLAPGDVVVLAGDLGAGKTTFVQGAATALGIQDHVTSPTFTLVRQYRGKWPVHHVDVYRLSRLQEVIDLGSEELLEPDGVTFVEWGDVIEGLLPDDVLHVELWVRAEDEGRMGVVTATGPQWPPRWERVKAAAEPWRPRSEA